MLTELAKRIDDEVGGFQIEVPCCLMAPLIECASNANRALTIFPSRVDAPHKHTIQVFHKRFMEEKKS